MVIEAGIQNLTDLIRNFSILLGLILILLYFTVKFTVTYSTLEQVENSFKFLDGKFVGCFFIVIVVILNALLLSYSYGTNHLDRVVSFTLNNYEFLIIIIISFALSERLVIKGFSIHIDLSKNVLTLALISFSFIMLTTITLFTLSFSLLYKKEIMTPFLILSYLIVLLLCLIYGTTYMYKFIIHKRNSVFVNITFKDSKVMNSAQLVSITTTGDLIVKPKVNNKYDSNDFLINRSEIFKIQLDKQ